MGDISHSPANRKATQTKEPPKYHSETRGQSLTRLLQKKRKHTQWVSATLGIQIQQEPLASRDLKAKVVRLGDGWQVDGRFTGSLDCYTSKLADSISALQTYSHTRPPPTPIRGGRDESEFEPNTADFKVDHHLWGHWAFIRTSRLLTLN